jgi:NADPH:quinone reductase-like Zn-dependent oxidoreductase
MAGAAGKVSVKMLTMVIGIPVGIVTRKLTEKAFAAARPNAEYHEAEDAGVDWKDALVWAAISGVGFAAAELITRRGAQEVYHVVTGNEPPAQLSKGQKKALKKKQKQEKKELANR